MTLTQALKVWWSYSWRASILLIPLAVLMTVWSAVEFVSALGDASLSAQNLSNLNFSNMSVDQLAHLAFGGMTMGIVSMVLTVVIQVFAMRWALNSRWSDFRLKAVPPDAEVAAGPRPGSGDPSRPAGV